MTVLRVRASRRGGSRGGSGRRRFLKDDRKARCRASGAAPERAASRLRNDGRAADTNYLRRGGISSLRWRRKLARFLSLPARCKRGNRYHLYEPRKRTSNSVF